MICREASMMPVRRLLSDKSPGEIHALRSQGLLGRDAAPVHQVRR
jgi:hypothetical protein